MSVVLLLLGVAVTGAGLATVGFGIALNELPIGSTLISAGTTATCSGLILIGLSAALSELRRVAEALKGRPGPRTNQPVDLDAAATPAIASVRPPPPVAPAPKPRPEAPVREPRVAEPPAAAVDVSAAAIERLRSSIPRADRPKGEPSVVAEGEEVPLSPNGGHAPPPPRLPEPRVEPRVTAADRPVAATVETVKPSRLDFLFRSRQARPEPRMAEPRLEARPPAVAPPAPPVPAAPVVHAPAVAEPVRAETPPAAEAQTPAILKSGVVDGMAYTLYADGSIEAKLPGGTVRFGSIAELRAHIESNA